MLLIGYTNSGREINFEKNKTWINREKKSGTPLTPQDIFDGCCLMFHMITHFNRENDKRKKIAEEYALEYKEYLVNLSLWEKLVKGRNASIPLHFAKLGKELALTEFK
jgi:hypothetical protein